LGNSKRDLLNKRLAVIGRQLTSNLRLALATADSDDEAHFAILEAPSSPEAMVLALRYFLLHKSSSAADSLDLGILILEIRAQTSSWNDADEDFLAARRLSGANSGAADWMYDIVELNSALRDENTNKLQEAETQYRSLALKSGYVAHVALSRLGLLALRRGSYWDAANERRFGIWDTRIVSPGPNGACSVPSVDPTRTIAV
jgi:hypothetical protein